MILKTKKKKNFCAYHIISIRLLLQKKQSSLRLNGNMKYQSRLTHPQLVLCDSVSKRVTYENAFRKKEEGPTPTSNVNANAIIYVDMNVCIYVFFFFLLIHLLLFAILTQIRYKIFHCNPPII